MIERLSTGLYTYASGLISWGAYLLTPLQRRTEQVATMTMSRQRDARTVPKPLTDPLGSFKLRGITEETSRLLGAPGKTSSISDIDFDHLESCELLGNIGKVESNSESALIFPILQEKKIHIRAVRGGKVEQEILTPSQEPIDRIFTATKGPWIAASYRTNRCGVIDLWNWKNTQEPSCSIEKSSLIEVQPLIHGDNLFALFHSSKDNIPRVLCVNLLTQQTTDLILKDIDNPIVAMDVTDDDIAIANLKGIRIYDRLTHEIKSSYSYGKESWRIKKLRITKDDLFFDATDTPLGFWRCDRKSSQLQCLCMKENKLFSFDVNQNSLVGCRYDINENHIELICFDLTNSSNTQTLECKLGYNGLGKVNTWMEIMLEESKLWVALPHSIYQIATSKENSHTLQVANTKYSFLADMGDLLGSIFKFTAHTHGRH